MKRKVRGACDNRGRPRAMATSQPRGGGAYNKHGLPVHMSGQGQRRHRRSSLVILMAVMAPAPRCPCPRKQPHSSTRRCPATNLRWLRTGESECLAAYRLQHRGLEIWIGSRVLELEECHSIQMGSERKIRLYVPYKWGIHRDDLTNWKISNGLNRCGRDFGPPTRWAPTAFLCVLTREVGSG